MTSLAILPTLKRTITDVMDEDLYHLPMSPIQLSNNQQSQLQLSQLPSQQSQREDAPKPRNQSTRSSPVLTNTQLANGSINRSNLPSLLNIPDSFIDQYTKNNISSSQLASATDFPVNEDFYNNLSYSNQTKIYPFTDYGNPDTQVNSYIKPQEIQKQNSFVPPFGRRRRITTLETSDDNSKNLKDEDYILFNPDIQPSQLINQKGFYDDFSDSSLFVPNQSSAFNDKIPGYENDYLLIDDFNEDVEEDISEDEDDNYFYDEEGDFDDLMMKGNDVMDLDDYFKNSDNSKSKDDLMGGFLDNYESTKSNDNIDRTINDDGSMDIEADDDDDAFTATPFDLEHNTESPIPRREFSASIEPDTPSPDESHQHKTAAEISASNPNHQCDLINPSTGHPCNKQFSRPYDLIRHQETIHATKKKIFRCVICEGRLNGGPGNGKLKTFSRGDALSRHIKVKHGLVGQDALNLINEAKENVEYVLV
ncbi:uncharacterized protein PRCAT00005504001 [Priceomyces carsonii]|uniref:uncharacterized protein n=1 Tax=Priceomyces carsonii TaxID=28549 RepID=UPI002ED82EBE|nr:unnamed protein product [Priceomyces carsonii]